MTEREVQINYLRSVLIDSFVEQYSDVLVAKHPKMGLAVSHFVENCAIAYLQVFRKKTPNLPMQ